MAFTSVLGTALCKPGNIELGVVGNASGSIFDIGASNTITFTQRANLQWVLSTSNTITFTCRGNLRWDLTASNAIAFSQMDSANFVAQFHGDNTLVFTQVAYQRMWFPTNTFVISGISSTLKRVQKSASNTFTVTQSAVFNTAATYPALNAMTYYQVAEGYILHPASNTIIFSNTADVDVAKYAFNAFVINQSATFNQVASKVASSNFIITQTVTPGWIRNFTVHHTLNFVGLASAIKATYRTGNVLFGLTHSASAFVIHTAHNSITFDDDASVSRVRNRSASNTLQFQQSATLTRVVVCTASNVFAVQNGQYRHAGEGLPEDIFVPGAQVVKIGACFTLTSGGITIVLPCPEFGDTDAFAGTMQIKRGLNGETYTYVHRSDLRQLKYTFRMGRQKSIEFRAFFDAHNSDSVTLTNWKGEVWRGYMTNNPFEVVARGRRSPCDREGMEVNLEFEGVRLI